ncbi:LytR C-terminal domain-containing protein [Candidatus Kaiserbacteria bacterium]|nr:LytR C-terminal domain-containing protein [Candidatus Kaiserbacteria bacterium]
MSEKPLQNHRIMILNFPKKRISYLTGYIILVLGFFILFLNSVSAQSLSLSVTPTLFEMSAEPEQSWTSSVRVINNNPFDLSVYATVVNFSPQGETGQGQFIPLDKNELDGSTLGEWIDTPKGVIKIPRESSAEIPVKLQVPKEAAPGGHYAAILISTEPPKTEGSAVHTSQVVTSLFFVRVAGDVVESGNVRSFRSVKRLVDKPSTTFELRFENTGNVHLQPRGEITITNMWGKERGIIPINRQTHFGNVLPNSIRKFEFTWNGQYSLADIGRYTAEVTLGYGQDAKQFSSRATHFWVLPLKGILLFIIVLVSLIWFIRFAIRSYVRRMLVLAGVDPNMRKSVPVSTSKLKGSDIKIQRRLLVTTPITSGYKDLSTKLSTVKSLKDKLFVLVGFVRRYQVFFYSLLAVGFMVFIILKFILIVTDSDSVYEIVIKRGGEDIVVSSEQVIYERTSGGDKISSEFTVEEGNNQQYELVLVNASGKSGVAASLSFKLQELGYQVGDLKSDAENIKDRTVIVYSPKFSEDALALSKQLENALLSADDATADTDPTITVYIGKDLLPE